MGCFGGGGLTNEKAYQLGKFARVALGTSQIDYNGRFCMSSAAAAATRAFGIDRGLPFPLADIAAADVVLLVGANPADTMPPAMQWFDEGRSRGATHITIDPRRSPTARGSKLHLQPVPGTDAEQHSNGTDTTLAFINLALALGLPGRPGSGFATITGQGNGQGGREHGQKADQLPGYRRLDDPQARAHVAAVWGVDPDSLPGPGTSAYEMLDRLGAKGDLATKGDLGTDGGVRTLLVFASNIAVSAPHATPDGRARFHPVEHRDLAELPDAEYPFTGVGCRQPMC